MPSDAMYVRRSRVQNILALGCLLSGRRGRQEDRGIRKQEWRKPQITVETWSHGRFQR